jgi:hypothetical protein
VGTQWDTTKWQRQLAYRRGILAVGAMAAPVVGVRCQDRKGVQKLERIQAGGVVQKCAAMLSCMAGDREAPFEHARRKRSYRRPRKVKVFTRAEGGYHHCQVDNISIGSAYIWDWAAEVLKAR